MSHARIAAVYLDVRVFLGEQSVTPIGEITFSENFCLVTTPEFAKLLVGLLSAQLANYEKIFGIRPPPQQTPKLMEALAKAQRENSQ